MRGELPRSLSRLEVLQTRRVRMAEIPRTDRISSFLETSRWWRFEDILVLFTYGAVDSEQVLLEADSPWSLSDLVI